MTNPTVARRIAPRIGRAVGRTLGCALLVGAIAGGVAVAQAQSSAMVGTPVADSTTLEVSLHRNSNDEPVFELNRPAYVAIFELRTGYGVTQIFPGSLDQARTSARAGKNYVSSAEVAWNRANSRAATDPGPRGALGVSRLRSTRVWLIVASDRPLQVSGPAGTSTALRRVDRLRALTGGTITTHDLEAVLAIVRPAEAKAEVVTDVLELPPY